MIDQVTMLNIKVNANSNGRFGSIEASGNVGLIWVARYLVCRRDSDTALSYAAEAKA